MRNHLITHSFSNYFNLRFIILLSILLASASSSQTVTYNSNRLEHNTKLDEENAPWQHAIKDESIVHFLFKSPLRIERYDLAQETWLTSIYLPIDPGLFADPDLFALDQSHYYLTFDKI